MFSYFNKQFIFKLSLTGAILFFIGMGSQAINSMLEKTLIVDSQAYLDWVYHPVAYLIGTLLPSFVGSIFIFFIIRQSLLKIVLQYRECPYCKETIKSDATICKFCKSNLEN